MNEKYEKVSSEIERIGIVPVIKLKKTENAGKLADALWREEFLSRKSHSERRALI